MQPTLNSTMAQMKILTRERKLRINLLLTYKEVSNDGHSCCDEFRRNLTPKQVRHNIR